VRGHVPADLPSTYPPPTGYRHVWVPDTHWTTDPKIVDGRLCRRQGTFNRYQQKVTCENEAVAALRRGNGWWTYCENHLYGRRIAADGTVLVRKAVPKKPEFDR
jgi:hypothetical protein